MIEISISEFRKNIKHYSTLVLKEDILVVNNGKPVMKVINPNKSRLMLAKSLLGSVPEANEEEILEDRIKEL